MRFCEPSREPAARQHLKAVTLALSVLRGRDSDIALFGILVVHGVANEMHKVPTVLVQDLLERGRIRSHLVRLDCVAREAADLPDGATLCLLLGKQLFDTRRLDLD